MIGIISDTHDNVERTRQALGKFKERGVELILHTGDLTSPDMLPLFAGFNTRFVLGNEDKEVDELNKLSSILGFGEIADKCSFEKEGKSFIMFHGTDVPFFRETVASGKYDYIIKGHTHFFENYFSQNSHIINPGALSNAYEFTVAILNTESDKVEMITLSD